MVSRALRRSATALFAGITAALAIPGVAVAEEPARKATASELDLRPDTFRTIHGLVRPHDTEWRHLRINWLTDVTAARTKSAAEDKPIVILYTGGAGYNEPLGVC